MKKIYNYLLVALTTVILLSSCTGKIKESAQNTVQSFMEAIKYEKEDAMTNFYPNFDKIGSYYKSDSYTIKDVEVLTDKKILVTIDNEFKNGFGKQFTQEIKFYLKPLQDKTYVIYDSEGIAGWKEKDEYKFAVNTGCIGAEDITDQQIAEKLSSANLMLVDLYLQLYLELMRDVRVSDWSWNTGYGSSASGKGIVKNNSNYDIPRPKYIVTYYDRNNNEITSDNGYITYDVLFSGSSKSFTFYTSYVGNARNAKISVDFDTEKILDFLMKRKYNGTEYESYLNRIAQNNQSKDKEEI